MTTTVASHPGHLTGMEGNIQCPPQAQAQVSPAPGHPESPTSAIIPQDPISTLLPPDPEGNNIAIDVRAKKYQRDQRLCALSKTFGHIPDVPVLSRWDSRKQCSASAVHRSLMAGICGNKRDGAFSIALSGIYADNEDGGDIIIYTGTGGRQRWTETFPRKRIRVGPQTQDQSWDLSSNKALMVSSHTGNPIRVIRSYRCRSKYAPLTGYRYDGLYKVTTCWTSKGKSGKTICRCRLERLPNQPPIPVRPPTLSTSRKRRERLVSREAPPQPNNSLVPVEMDVDAQSGIQSDPPPLMPESNDPAMGKRGSRAEQQRPLSSQRPASSNKNVDILKLPRYRWDPKTNGLIRLPPQEDPGAEGEDDVTLVPDEDGVSDVSDMDHQDEH